MDQCEDCNEVVCGNCSTLMSCKFCGCGLCEDCATACGRCGIVLCARDAKFAVECDTCRMPYCLVCLASGSKDPCVRCGHRPSKRVEQLVHLRLKSIYKAFKQSGAALEGKKDSDNTNRKDDSSPDLSLTGDVGAVLQAAAAAAHTSCQSNSDEYHESNEHSEQEKVPGKRILEAERRRIKILRHEKSNSIKEKNNDDAQKIFSRTQAEADAAAAALLAEIDLEEEKRPTEKTNKKKKKKKKSKTTNQSNSNDKNSNTTIKSNTTQISTPLSNTPSSPLSSSSSVPHENEIDEDDIILNFHQSRSQNKNDVDNSVESQLTQFISNSDIDGIEKLLNMLRGVPGRAALRKNAKKALKKLKEDHEQQQQRLHETKEGNQNRTSSETCSVSDTSSSFDNTINSYKAPEPLLKLISSKMKPNHKSECVMHMAPSVVGWVIGKGGQRIRDLMVESGAKVWIDQDSMGSKEARIVYVSGGKTNVDCAVRMVKDLVAKAPVGSGIGSTVILKDFTKGPNLLSNSLSRSQSSPVPDSIDEQRPTISSSVQTIFSKTKNPNSSISQQQHKTESMTISSKPTTKFDNHNAGIITEIITCEPMFVALLIGRRGWTVKHIQDASGAKVDIDQSVTPRIITVSGDKKSVRSAVKMVNDVLSYPHAQLRYGEKEGDVNPCFEHPILDMKSNRYGRLNSPDQYIVDNQDFEEDGIGSNNQLLSSNICFSSHSTMDMNFSDGSDQRYKAQRPLTSSYGHNVTGLMHDLESSSHQQDGDDISDGETHKKDMIEKKSQLTMNDFIESRKKPIEIQEKNLHQSLIQNCDFSSANLSQTSIPLNSGAQAQQTTGYLDFSKKLPTVIDNTPNQIQGETLLSDNYNHSSGWTSGHNYLDPILPFEDHSENVNLMVGKYTSNTSSDIQIGSQLIGNESQHQHQKNRESSMIDMFASSSISQNKNLQSSQSIDSWSKGGSTIPGWGRVHAQDNINGLFGNNISDLWGGISLDFCDTGINGKETSNR